MSTIETFGEDLPGLLMECVVNPDKPERLMLHCWDGSKVTTRHKVEYEGLSYIPRKVEGAVAQSVRFPPPSSAFKSTGKLISLVRDFLATYVRLHKEGENLLLAFGLASWFCDLVTVAPVINICGSEEACSEVLRLLACFCRRPALVGDIDFSALITMPNRMCATLLVNQRRLGRRVQNVLLASQRRHFGLLHGMERLDVYGAKAFSCENLPTNERGLTVTIPPARNLLPPLTDSQERVMTRTFQSRLLRYRMLHYGDLRNQNIDTSALIPERREEARSWLAPIVECPELSDSVRAEISRQSEEAAGARFAEPKSVVIEAALFLCHKPDVEHFYVGDLAQVANDLLQGRHEESKLSEKRVGSLLREVGIHGRRVAAGYRVALTDVVRRRIHELAADYAVPTLDNRERRCDNCSEVVPPEQPEQ